MGIVVSMIYWGGTFRKEAAREVGGQGKAKEGALHRTQGQSGNWVGRI